MVLYFRADSWLGWGEASESDNVVRSLARILGIAVRGFLSPFRSLFTQSDEIETGETTSDKPRRKLSAFWIARLSLWLLAAALLVWKLLIVSSANAYLTLQAQAVALRSYLLTIPQSAIDHFHLLAERVVNARLHLAQNWEQTGHTIALWDYANGRRLQGHGMTPLNLYFIAVSLWRRLTLSFVQVPWPAAIVVVGLAFLFAVWMRRWLRGRALARLSPTEA